MKLSWEIEVISRAVAYPNLSIAASQIGLSQPQISRILKRVEEALGVSLLDRDSKRKASWKPLAHDLVSHYLKLARQWEADLQSFSSEPGRIKRIRIGCLEGISEAVVDFLTRLTEAEKELEEIELEILDLGDLEKGFLEGDYDLVFTSRSPGKKKFSHTLVMGYQKFENFRGSSDWVVRTPFELAQEKKGSGTQKRIVTKSLWIKRLCVERLKASGKIPSRLKKFPSQKGAADPSAATVFVIGAEGLPRHFWRDIESNLH